MTELALVSSTVANTNVPAAIAGAAVPTPELLQALAAAQAAFPTVAKTRTASVKSEKGSYQYGYAGLPDVLAAVVPVLAQHGLALTHRTEVLSSGAMLLHAEIHHAGGGVLRSSVPLPAPDRGGWQPWGSALSYARRYTLCALLGIAAEDDDGEAADRARKPARAARATQAVANAATPDEVAAEIAAAASIEGLKAVVERNRPTVQTFPQSVQDRLAAAKAKRTRELRAESGPTDLSNPFGSAA